MTSRSVIGVYDSLSKAEKAELRLEETHLPVGQMSLIAPKTEAGEVKDDFASGQVASALASAGARPSREQIAGYEQALKAGKHLLIFHGDPKHVTEAYHALEDTSADELTSLDG